MKRVKRIIAAVLSCSLLLSACASAEPNGNLDVLQEMQTIQVDSKADVNTSLAENKQETLSDETIASEQDILDGTVDEAEEEEKFRISMEWMTQICGNI